MNQSANSYHLKFLGRFDVLALCAWHTVLAFCTFAENEHNILQVYMQHDLNLDRGCQVETLGCPNQSSNSTRLA